MTRRTEINDVLSASSHVHASREFVAAGSATPCNAQVCRLHAAPGVAPSGSLYNANCVLAVDEFSLLEFHC
jgi:hypothetical protein